MAERKVRASAAIRLTEQNITFLGRLIFHKPANKISYR